MRESSLCGIALLEKLSLTFGPSGCEERVAEAIIETVSPFADEVVRDRSGGVIAVLRGTGKAKNIRRVMLSAHMDEVGFMISSAEDDGTLKLAPLSARDPKILAGQYVTLSDGERFFDGVVGINRTTSKKTERRNTAICISTSARGAAKRPKRSSGRASSALSGRTS